MADVDIVGRTRSAVVRRGRRLEYFTIAWNALEALVAVVARCSRRQSILLSQDLKGFHFDTNGILAEQVQGTIRRAQFGQTLSISHSLGKFTISGEVWHFSQPFEKGSTVGNLWAVSRALRKNLVVDAGFNRGLTKTSTRWEAFVGFTYLLPHHLWMARPGSQP